MRGITSASSRQARAVVSSSWLRVIQKSGRVVRSNAVSASASRAIAAPMSRSKPAVVAHPVLHIGAGRQCVDVRLAEHDRVRVGDGQPEHGPDSVRRDREAGRAPRQRCAGCTPADQSVSGIACQAEQAAAAFGLNHLLGGEAEAVQVFDQRGALARVGNSGGLKRIEIDHPPKSASSEATIRVDSREGL